MIRYIIALILIVLLLIAHHTFAAWPGSGRFSGSSPGGCTNSLNFAQACNSSYIGALP